MFSAEAIEVARKIREQEPTHEQMIELAHVAVERGSVPDMTLILTTYQYTWDLSPFVDWCSENKQREHVLSVLNFCLEAAQVDVRPTVLDPSIEAAKAWLEENPA